MEKFHIPVLLSEVLTGLAPKPNESYLDLTAGFGGHAREILDVTQNYKNSVLVDRDEFAAKHLAQEFTPDTTIINTDFYNAVLQLLQCGKTFDMILADLEFLPRNWTWRNVVFRSNTTHHLICGWIVGRN